jgi:hypothetical protein
MRICGTKHDEIFKLTSKCYFCRYGDFVVLKQHDHIAVCKPSDKDDPSYSHLLRFLQRRAAEAEAGGP